MKQHKIITNTIPFFLLFIATAFAAMQIEYFIGNYFTMMAVVCTVLIILCCILNFWPGKSEVQCLRNWGFSFTFLFNINPGYPVQSIGMLDAQ